jgi:hypothetical protein
VAVSGTTAVVGDPLYNSDEGGAYIYEKGASGWPTAPTFVLTDPEATADDEFGNAAAVSITGTTVVVGAVGANTLEGAVYIYEKGASGWSTTPTTTLTDPAATEDDSFGDSLAISRLTAMTLVVGASGVNTNSGAAYIYVNSSSGWPTTPTTSIPDPTATADSLFGYSVAVSGPTVVVGDPGANTEPGTAYIYLNGGSGWPTTPNVTLADPAATAGDVFGASVAVSKKTVLVGAIATKSGRGAAYIYLNGASGWPTAPTATLSDPADAAGEAFGFVALQGTNAVVGAPGANNEAGLVYIYTDGRKGWSTVPSVTLSDPAATANDLFGISEAVQGNTLVVGAPGTDTEAGAAYIYKA